MNKSNCYKELLKRLGTTIQWYEFEEALRIGNINKFEEEEVSVLFKYFVKKLYKEKRYISKKELQEEYQLSSDQIKGILERANAKWIVLGKGNKRMTLLPKKEANKVREYIKNKYKRQDKTKKEEQIEIQIPDKKMDLDYFIERIESVIKYNNLLKRENESQKKLLEIADKEIVRLKNIIEEDNRTIDELNNEIYIYKNKEQDKNEGFLNKLKEIFRGCYD